MHTDISIFQIYPNAEVVNVPDYGPIPDTDFDVQISGNTVTFVNNSLDATLFYWTFGDGEVSNDINPTHTYSDSGAYTVILRASSDLSMMGIDSMEINIDTLPTDISDIDNKLLPTEFSLFQNYPNPFNAVTSIRFGMPEASEVQIAVYNILGQRVTVLLDAWKPVGYHTVKFDASELTSGLYFYKIQSDKFIKVRKMLLMK
jgi:PKD repeat protein